MFCLSFFSFFAIETIDTKITETDERRYTVTSKLRLRPTADDDYVDYTCQARHQAIQEDRPMQATVQLSVLCKYLRSASSFRWCGGVGSFLKPFFRTAGSVLMATYTLIDQGTRGGLGASETK
ncbi:AGAP010742-PA-like protein [Anopheles sinensis]|uniref:AGAP010742-PA-like protein n=1 Tax=Anopheles sinensis TaxID=74873 RepID=A0A084WAR8_ANOSI|nr:AGAP010742-PA-like protein [Anopheles sinensis]